VVASGRYLRPYAGIAELEEHDLTSRGVPPSAVVRFAHHAENTREEALELRRLISERGWSRMVVVTSNYHTRRARYICLRTFPPGSVLRVVAARDAEFDADNWWRTRRGTKIFLHELVGMFVAVWEMRHARPRPPDSAFAGPCQALVAGLYSVDRVVVYS
jgi:hypothetical protein